MGTRSEIIVTNPSINSWIELWKRWDGYPEYMINFFKEAAEYAAFIVGNQTHLLSYPEDVAAMLIGFDWTWRIGNRIHDQEFVKYGFLKGDLRPRGSIFELEYFYVLDVSHGSEGYWKLTCYEFHGSISEKYMKVLRKKAAMTRPLPNNIFTHITDVRLELKPNIPESIKPVVVLQILYNKIK
ncbi:MAG: hypothetical protein QXL06_01865 [Nitrososphaerota archaeon]